MDDGWMCCGNTTYFTSQGGKHKATRYAIQDYRIFLDLES